MILCVGCSWTYGLGVQPHQAYPAHLQNLIGEKIINAGSPGTDIQYAIYSAYRLMQEYDFRLLIFQLTTLDRLTLGVNGKTNFLNGNYYKKTSNEINFDDNNYIRVKNIGSKNIQLITPASYIEAQQKNNSELNTTTKFLMENTIHDNYKQDCLSISLNAIQQKIPTVFFPWVNWHSEFKNSLIGYDINIPQFSVKEFLEQSSKTDMYLDNGYHLTDEGNKFVAEEYVLHLLKDLV
jgi:hypothetical protein